MNYTEAKYNKVDLRNSVEDDKIYTVLMFCDKCGALLTTTPARTGKEIKDRWFMICMSAGFSAPRCPSCNYSTERDINLGTDLLILEGDHTNDPDIVAKNKPSALVEDLRNESNRD